jgi:hypothetical protein
MTYKIIKKTIAVNNPHDKRKRYCVITKGEKSGSGMYIFPTKTKAKKFVKYLKGHK